MKTKLILAVAALTLATLNSSAQDQAGLDIQTYAGMTITGAVGRVYSIEYATDLAETNTPRSAWRCLEFLQLPASPYLWVDKSAPVEAKRFYRAGQMEAPTNLVFIPPGTFRMGSPIDEPGRYPDEGPQTTVTISRGFWMGKYEVTQGEYKELTGNNPSYFNGVRVVDGEERDYGTDLSRPVEQVSWNDAVAYCDALTVRERSAGRISSNSVYRLPTEAEWEYACRAWTSTRFYYGEDPGYTNLATYAWYPDNSMGMTHTAGQKLPNRWGLYDMAGNIFEFCQDYYDTKYPGGLAIDPQGPLTGDYRIIRGSCWSLGYPNHLRSAFRSIILPDIRASDFGFRVVLAPGQP